MIPKRLTLLITVLLLAAAISGSDKKSTGSDKDSSANTSQENRYREITSQFKLFGEVYREVNRRYVDPIEAEDFIHAGISGGVTHD